MTPLETRLINQLQMYLREPNLRHLADAYGYMMAMNFERLEPQTDAAQAGFDFLRACEAQRIALDLEVHEIAAVREAEAEAAKKILIEALDKLFLEA